VFNSVAMYEAQLTLLNQALFLWLTQQIQVTNFNPLDIALIPIETAVWL